MVIKLLSSILLINTSWSLYKFDEIENYILALELHDLGQINSEPINKFVDFVIIKGIKAKVYNGVIAAKSNNKKTVE